MIRELNRVEISSVCGGTEVEGGKNPFDGKDDEGTVPTVPVDTADNPVPPPKWLKP